MPTKYGIIGVAFGLILCLDISSAELQKYAATGTLLCGTKPASGIKVVLVDIDTLTTDNTLDQKTTDSEGKFYLEGKTDEMTNIDPQLQITHSCLARITNRYWRFNLPQSYIGHGHNSKPVAFNFGTINLEVEPEAEGREFGK